MRLINVYTLELRDFTESEIPFYAILSHCWGDQEVLFEDFNRISLIDTAGSRKVLGFCQFVKWRNHDPGVTEPHVWWVWVDTCCIDKRSSAELSEAINSMFKWYMGALYAVAYLSDVFARADDHESLDLKRSRWFTRGWCLQELVAPFNLLFCNRDWTLMGSKIGLVSQIEEVTGIDRHYLQSPRSIFQASVAQRMSWASKRETTRTEDIAYCLMGIFDINMPLLYGEGYKAFLRLQREIIEQSDDESIFAWTATSPADAVELDPNMRQWCVLSNRPSDFERSRNVRRTNDSASQYGISNRGIRFETIVRHIDYISQSQEALHLVDLVVIQLGCARGDIAHWSKPEIGGGEIANASPCMLALTKMVWSDRWYRVHPGSLDLSTLRDVILEGTEMRRGIVENKVLYLGADMTEFIEPSSWSLGPVSVTENRLWRHLFPDS